MIILMGESGSGKTTILNELEKRGYKKAVNYTTRPKRDGEEKNQEYVFTTKEKFEEMWKENKLLQRAEFNEQYYGISVESLSEEVVAISIVDSIGDIKKRAKELGKDNVKIQVFYLLVPSEERIQRMLKRGDSIDAIQKKIAIDKEKFVHVKEVADHIIENKEIEKTVNKIIELSN